MCNTERKSDHDMKCNVNFRLRMNWTLTYSCIPPEMNGIFFFLKYEINEVLK